MKQILSCIAISLLLSAQAAAQHARFITEGAIEFSKNVNMHAIMKKMAARNNSSFSQEMTDQYIRNQPQFKVLKSTLTFSKNKTLFKPSEENAVMNWSTMAASQNNTIFTDLTTGQSVIQKKVFEETFLVSDSTRKIKWKITDETRNIAGYDCRRANALIMDSIYVVAFYTDEIIAQGGPESFSGLPGMILGIALPHDHITWFASSVSDKAIAPGVIVPPKKGKPINNKDLKEKLLTVMKDWGDSAKELLKDFTL